MLSWTQSIWWSKGPVIISYKCWSYDRNFTSLSHPSRLHTLRTTISNTYHEWCAFIFMPSLQEMWWCLIHKFDVYILRCLLWSCYNIFGFLCNFEYCIKDFGKSQNGTQIQKVKNIKFCELLSKFMNFCKWTEENVLCNDHYCLSIYSYVICISLSYLLL